MGKLTVTTTNTKTTNTIVVLAGKELLEVLKPLITQLGYGIEDVKSLYVQVPGGGDWSNTRLDIETESPLVMVLEKVEINE